MSVEKIKESLVHAIDSKPVNFAKDIEAILEEKAFAKLEDLRKIIENDDSVPPRQPEDDYDDEEEFDDEDLDEEPTDEEE